MSDLVSLHHRSSHRYDDLVDLIPDAGWEDPTPCSDWSVRELVHHMVYEALWAPPLLAGATLEEVGGRFGGDLLGADPRAAFHVANAGERAAVTAEVLERDVHTSMGVIPASVYLGQRLSDLVVHGWDLAQGIRVEAGLDLEAVAYCYDMAKPQEAMMKASGLFGEWIEEEPGSDTLSRLLAVFGRHG